MKLKLIYEQVKNKLPEIDWRTLKNNNDGRLEIRSIGDNNEELYISIVYGQNGYGFNMKNTNNFFKKKENVVKIIQKIRQCQYRIYKMYGWKYSDQKRDVLMTATDLIKSFKKFVETKNKK